MINVRTEGDTVIFNVEGSHKLWAFKSSLEVPRASIQSARHDPEAVRGWWKGWRMPGTSVPGIITAGTFYHHGRRIFWDIMDADNAVVVELDDHDYDQLIIEVENPASVVDLLNGKD